MSKICTDIPQSKKLAKILSIESADAHYVRESTDLMGNPVDGKWSEIRLGNPEKANYIVMNFSSYEILPCWSLTALLEIIRKPTAFDLLIDGRGFRCHCRDKHEGKFYGTDDYCDNPIDACVEIILKLHKLNLL